MIETDKNGNIKIPRGDSETIAFELTEEATGDPYFLDNGEYVVFSVAKIRGGTVLISKTLTEQTESGAVIVSLSPEDTDIERGEHIYTLRLYNADATERNTVLGGIDTAIFEVT